LITPPIRAHISSQTSSNPTRKFSFPFPLTIASSPPADRPPPSPNNYPPLYYIDNKQSTRDFEYLLFSDPQAVYIRSDNFWFRASPPTASVLYTFIYNIRDSQPALLFYIYDTHTYMYTHHPSIYIICFSVIYRAPLRWKISVLLRNCIARHRPTKRKTRRKIRV